MLKEYATLLNRFAAFSTAATWCLLFWMVENSWFFYYRLTQWLKSSVLMFFLILILFFNIFIQSRKVYLISKPLFQIDNILLDFLLLFNFLFQDLLLHKPVLLLIRIEIELWTLRKYSLISHSKLALPQKLHFLIRV